MSKSLQSDWRDWLADLLGLHPEDRRALLKMLRKAGRRGGAVSPEEMKMVEGILGMREWKIRDIMIPLSDVVCMKSTDDYRQAVALVREWQHSRYPVVDDSGEGVLGILLAKDLLGFTDSAASFSMTQAMREVVFEPDSKPLDNLLEDFRTNRSHMVVVRDEYAQAVGIVTIEDLLERIVGEIEDESDEEEDRDMQPQPDGATVVKGTLSIEEFNARFDSDLPANGADSIAGWLAATLGHMPRTGESCEAHGLIFTIREADERRIHHITVMRRTASTTSPGAASP